MRTLHARSYGEPAKVLQLDEVAVPVPTAERIRVKVHACALNPADWAVCQGFFPLPPPRGIGFDVSGTVDEIGAGVTSVKVGDRVFGVPDYLGYSTAGASDYAILKVWIIVPKRLDLTQAAALPMAVETATRSIDLLGLKSGQSILVNGGGTMTGFAAVQIALLRGAKVITTAGDTYAERDPRRVMSFSDFDEGGLGVRTTGREKGVVQRYDVLDEYAQLAAEGRFTIPISQTFPLEDWRNALDLSLNRLAHGKLVLLLDHA
jgi:NADPH:quinone reductase-like Zn-dependent oxidoreductase